MPSPRDIPSIDLLRKRGAVQRLEARYGSGATLDALRAVADAARLRLRAPAEAPAPGAEPEDLAGVIEAEAGARLLGQFQGSLRPVVNATGVIIHTNLGRAPLARAAIDRLAATAGGYTNLEYDLARGERGSRAIHAEALLTILTGAEAAVVVNNNAAATLLMLAALARGREVLISRGELVEIGGGFRVPDVMAQSGADLREVGTTNRTRVADYTVAAGPRTALILRVHPSNFRVEGFTEEVGARELAELGRELGLPTAFDLGSGLIEGDEVTALPDVMGGEPRVREAVASGVDVVAFSGDKLFGGPQAGMLVGRRNTIAALRKNPVYRALRLDKVTIAGLERTLSLYLEGRGDELPARAMLQATAEQLRPLAERLAAALGQLPGCRAEVIPERSQPGSGSAPGVFLPTCAVRLTHSSLAAGHFARELRRAEPPVFARVQDDALLLDPRTLLPGDEPLLVSAVRAVVA